MLRGASVDKQGGRGTTGCSSLDGGSDSDRRRGRIMYILQHFGFNFEYVCYTPHSAKSQVLPTNWTPPAVGVFASSLTSPTLLPTPPLRKDD